jgi:hypothetical protein
MCEENYETAMLCGPELNNYLQHRDHRYSVFRKLKKIVIYTFIRSDMRRPIHQLLGVSVHSVEFTNIAM